MGGLISGALSGIGSAIRGGSKEQFNNQQRAKIADIMNTDPFGTTADAAKYDLMKSKLADFGMMGMVNPHTLNMLGSTRPNIPGLTADYQMAKHEDVPWWKKALAGALQGVGAAAGAFMPGM